MFEDSTFETMGRIHTRSRGWMMATFAFNSSILLALVIIPIIHPEMLPKLTSSILMQAPPPVQQPRPVVRTVQMPTAPYETSVQVLEGISAGQEVLMLQAGQGRDLLDAAKLSPTSQPGVQTAEISPIQ